MNYMDVIMLATQVGNCKYVYSNNPWYDDIVKYIRGLKDVYRINMYSYVAIRKELSDSTEYDLMIEFYRKHGVFTVGLCHKSH